MEHGRDGHDARREFWKNLRGVMATLRRTIFRHGIPRSDRSRSQAVFGNFFLHIHSARIHRHSLKWTTTLGLGIITAALFVLLTITGILLMFYYKPSVDQAYDSIKDLHYAIPTGRLIRNIHRWAAHGMVITVILHMSRVFYTAAYKSPREFNWILGIFLFVLTLALSFTGYLLPWDQLGYWAATIGANIAESPRELTDAIGITESFDIGGFQKELVLGAHYVGQEALIRFHVMHVIILPLALSVILAVHFWRIRKDGGLARPANVDGSPDRGEVQAVPEKLGLLAVVRGKSSHTDQDLDQTVSTWPNTFYVELALTMCTIAGLVLLGYLLDAPLKEPANPSVPENPAKAPWYFLGLQELVSYSAFMGGIGIPAIVLIGLALIPYLDREKKDVGIWFGRRRGWRVTWRSAVFCAISVTAMLIFNVVYGWLRDWFPDIPQIVITFVNPGTILVVLFAWWSLRTLRRENSTRLAAIALYTCFLVGFVLLTYFATVHRGPNWDFFWTASQWPTH